MCLTDGPENSLWWKVKGWRRTKALGRFFSAVFLDLMAHIPLQPSVVQIADDLFNSIRGLMGVFASLKFSPEGGNCVRAPLLLTKLSKMFCFDLRCGRSAWSMTGIFADCVRVWCSQSVENTDQSSGLPAETYWKKIVMQCPCACLCTSRPMCVHSCRAERTAATVHLHVCLTY